MPDRHVQPSDGEWTVTVPGDEQVTARTATEVEAVERAVTIVSDHGGGDVVVHGEGGEVIETRHVDAGASTPEISRTAAEIAENAGVEGAVETVEAALGDSGPGEDAATASAERTGHTPEAVHQVGGTEDRSSDSSRDRVDSNGRLADSTRAAAREAGATAEAVGEDAADTAEDEAQDASATASKAAAHTRTGARKAGATAAAAGSGIADQVEAVGEGEKDLPSAAKDAASIAQTTGEQIADRAEGTAREVAGEARASGRRAAARVDAGARQAGEDAVAGADRTASLGAQVGQEAESASDRVGQQIHAYTEAVAAPLDQVAHALNPVRITGRVVGVVVAGGLHLFGVGAERGTAAAQQGARRVAHR
jgi:hypothetical protein